MDVKKECTGKKFDNKRNNPCAAGQVDKTSAAQTLHSVSIPDRVKPETAKIGIHSFPAVQQ